jgi:hypothetical protein
MEFEGRIQRVLPVRSGRSERTGNEWKTLPFVFEYFESGDQRWSDKVLLETMDTNIMAQIGAYLKKGPDGKAVVENGECVLLAELKCKVGFSHSVKTYDKQDGTKTMFNDLRLYKFEVLVQGAAVTQQHTQQQNGQQNGGYQPQAPFPPVNNDGDDLPF